MPSGQLRGLHSLAFFNETTNKEITYGYDPGKVFEYLVIMAKGDANGNSATLTGLKLNGADLGSGTISAPPNYHGMIAYLSDAGGPAVSKSKGLLNYAGVPDTSRNFQLSTSWQ